MTRYILFFSLIIFISCGKSGNHDGAISSNPSLTTSMEVESAVNFETDTSSYDFDSIALNILRIEIHKTGASWIIHDENIGEVLITNINEDLTRIISSNELSPGKYTMFRIILTGEQFITINNETFPLIIPSSEITGLKIPCHFTLEEGNQEIRLSFNIEKQLKNRKTEYFLIPVLKCTIGPADDMDPDDINPDNPGNDNTSEGNDDNGNDNGNCDPRESDPDIDPDTAPNPFDPSLY